LTLPSRLVETGTLGASSPGWVGRITIGDGDRRLGLGCRIPMRGHP